ncbi:MAG: cell envelope integrity protein CreD [Bacteroidales bacterium]|nr:cell envelope integrity protein CreD [Bacteroidales bacterium]
MEQKNQNKFVKWLKTSLTIKMFIVGFLTLILLIPLTYIGSLIDERQDRQESVVKEINEKWGEEVLLYGPVLEVPYLTYTEVVKKDEKTKSVYTERTAQMNYAYFFPKSLNVNSTLLPQIKHRNLYNSVVYQGKIKIDGQFIKPDFKSLSVPESNILWSKARMIVKTSNLKGITNQVALKIKNSSYDFIPKYIGKNYNTVENNGRNYYDDSNYYNDDYLTMNSLETSTLDTGTVKKPFSFNIEMAVNGSEQLRIIPVGQETKMTIKSNWKDPSFIGNYLPYNKDKQTATGFDAKWKVLNINRPFPQTFSNELPDLKDYAFGVNLMIPVDQYQQSTRSAKYGYLVIALTFLIFFLIQSISKIDIHPFQYFMIGLALVMFYTLLISISEHSSFLTAYLIAGVSVILLISIYSRSILKKWKFPAFITASLTALYSFIYVIIQLENYALLVGSIGLFLILAVVMFVSRKIDWNPAKDE